MVYCMSLEKEKNINFLEKLCKMERLKYNVKGVIDGLRMEL